MENIEKVDRLRERANVSYEEAKAALESANWDLLDACVELEKQGKTRKPEQTSYSTEYEAQDDLVNVTKKVEEQRSEQKERKASVHGVIRKFIKICRDNYFSVMKGEDTVAKLPIWALVIALCFAWKPILIVGVIALFFGLRYKFTGRDSLDSANEFMDSASQAADKVKAEFQKKDDTNTFEK